MNVVKFLREDPFVFCVVDFELQVGWNAGTMLMGKLRLGGEVLFWLDEGEVCSYDTS
jgi:hypothetical protein